MDITGKLLKEWEENGLRWEIVAERARSIGFEVWNPALYAIDVYNFFLKKFPPLPGAILALGLNPGPFGMAQTGIPFTDCRTARKKLGIDIEIPGRAPADLAARLKKTGGKWKGTFERSSIVIYRFIENAWGGSLEKAFENWYVGNPCPLFFLEPDGWNVTPADTRLRRIEEITRLRIMAVKRFYDILKPRGIICLGKNVAEVLGATADKLVGDSMVIRYSHPARAIPDEWSKGLTQELKVRRLI